MDDDGRFGDILRRQAILDAGRALGFNFHFITGFYRRFFQQQFKRSCIPDGPKVGSVTLSPRGDWRMPSDASAAAWLREVEEL